MRLSVPIYQLKKQAKVQSRQYGVALNKALDDLAKKEGFASWSLLAKRHANRSPAAIILQNLSPGDLVLLGGDLRERHDAGVVLIRVVLGVTMRRSRTEDDDETGRCEGVFIPAAAGSAGSWLRCARRSNTSAAQTPSGSMWCCSQPVPS